MLTPCYPTLQAALASTALVIRGVLPTEGEPGSLEIIQQLRVATLVFLLVRFRVSGRDERPGVALLVLEELVGRGWMWQAGALSLPEHGLLRRASQYLPRFSWSTDIDRRIWWAFGRCSEVVAGIRVVADDAIVSTPKERWFALGGLLRGPVTLEVYGRDDTLLESVVTGP